MSDTDIILQALAQVVYQAGRLDERGLAATPLDPPLDALLDAARATFAQLDRIDAFPVADQSHSDADAPVTRTQIRAALRPFVALYHELSADELGGGDDLAVIEVLVSDLARAENVYRAL
jgi:hypothetical protein